MKTRVIEAVKAHRRWPEINKATEQSVKQAILDDITPDVMKKVAAKDLENHTIAIYDATADVYANNPLHANITNELIDFMELDVFHNGSSIIDLGAGTGRDAFFMSSRSRELRWKMMARKKNGILTRDQYRVPIKQFNVLAIEGSSRLFSIAQKRQKELSEMHPELTDNPCLVCDNMHEPNIENGLFDGIWSCAALFTHTPKELIRPALSQIANGLKRGGVFGTSFTQAQDSEGYDKLLASSTGEIKYFSQPRVRTIIESAKSCGLHLIRESYDDMCNSEGKIIKKDLFATLFLQKI